MEDTPRCTRCDRTDAVPIIWGMPSPELLDAVSTGEVDAIIGGCCVTEPAPTHECRRCGSRFAEGARRRPARLPVFIRADSPQEIIHEIIEHFRSNTEPGDT